MGFNLLLRNGTHCAAKIAAHTQGLSPVAFLEPGETHLVTCATTRLSGIARLALD